MRIVAIKSHARLSGLMAIQSSCMYATLTMLIFLGPDLLLCHASVAQSNRSHLVRVLPIHLHHATYKSLRKSGDSLQDLSQVVNGFAFCDHWGLQPS